MEPSSAVSEQTVGVRLWVPPLPRVVGEGVFDGYGHSRSEGFVWRRPAGRALERNPLGAELPRGVAFVFHGETLGLPAELARLHVGGSYGLEEERCLAPYAIDDATDRLFEERVAAEKLFWVATDNLDGLFWALHDWSHFHNHGPFEDPTATELQCDLSALAWLYLNAERVGLAPEELEALRVQCAANQQKRCEAQPPSHKAEAAWLEDPARLRKILRSFSG